MATTSFGQQETRRRKWIAAIVSVGLAGTVLTVALAFLWNRARQDRPEALPPALPTDVQNQASGYSFTQSVGERKLFTVRAARTVAFKVGGATVLEDVVVEMFGRQGNRHDVLRTRVGEYNPRSGDFSGPEEVEIELNAPTRQLAGPASPASPDPPARESASHGHEPVTLETSKVVFKQQGSLATTNEPVRFRMGATSGSGRGMKYATQDGWLELEHDVVVDFQPGGAAATASAPSATPRSALAWLPWSSAGQPGTAGPAVGARARAAQPPIRLTARHLRYEAPRGASGTVTLEGPVEIVQATRRAVAESGTLLLDSQNRLTEARLDGDVRALDSSEGRSMQGKAQNVRGEFDRATGQLRLVTAEGGVVAELHRGAPGGSSTRLEAQQLEIAVQGQQPLPQYGTASGGVRLTLDSSGVPARGKTPPAGSQLAAEKKNLSAAEVQFTFRTDGKSLSEMRTPGEGQLTLVPSDPNVGQREITAGRLSMAFDARSRLETLVGLSHARVVFRPARNALPGTPAQDSSSDQLEATFDPATQALGQMEQVGNYQYQEGDRHSTAEHATYLASNQTMTLVGEPRVSDPTTRATAERLRFHLDSGTAEGLGKVASTHFGAAAAPGAAAADPTHVLADRMQAERRSQFVHYERHVRAWQGADVVESSSLDVSRAQRRMSSGTGVLTSHFQVASSAAGATSTGPHPARETRPVTIHAERLDYFDEGRKASYHGNVELRTENTTMRADHMDVFFSNAPSGQTSEIERAVGDGHVIVTQPGRHAVGDHADYEAASGKMVMTGGPPRLDDAEKGSATGQHLTFFVHDDRLIVDGGEKSPSLSQHRLAP